MKKEESRVLDTILMINRKARVKRTFPHIYRRLKEYGFSGFKASEIVLDAKRGDEHALRIIGVIRKK